MPYLDFTARCGLRIENDLPQGSGFVFDEIPVAPAFDGGDGSVRCGSRFRRIRGSRWRQFRGRAAIQIRCAERRRSPSAVAFSQIDRRDLKLAARWLTSAIDGRKTANS